MHKTSILIRVVSVSVKLFPSLTLLLFEEIVVAFRFASETNIEGSYVGLFFCTAYSEDVDKPAAIVQ